MKSEFEWIEEFQRKLNAKSKKVLVGIGDDACVTLPAKGGILATVDRLVEKVHFDLRWSPPESIGYKALAVSLSDIAAMGGCPLYALVSLSFPSKTPDIFVSKIYRGLKRVASEQKVQVVGGNLSTSSSIIIDTTVIGEVSKKVLLRSTAAAGDAVMVTGYLGESAAGLALLKKASEVGPSLVQAHLFPHAKIEIGLQLAKTPGVRCCIDISDGLSSELYHLAKASGVGFRIKESSVPLSAQVRKAGKLLKINPLDWALGGGEDYQLLFTVASDSVQKVKTVFKKKGWDLFEIGRVIKERNILMETSTGNLIPLKKQGWLHF